MSEPASPRAAPERGPPALSNRRLAWFLPLGLRVLLSVVAAALVPFLKLDPELVRANRLTEDLIPRSSALYPVLGVWQRFDTLHYVEIATQGYGRDRPEAIVFYPLYPVLIRGLATVGLSPLVAALLVATLAAGAFFVGLERLLALDHDEARVRRALLFAAVWPPGFVLFAAYADSLVLALVVWAVYLARREQWAGAGALGLLAGLAKAVGVLAAVPLLVLAWRSERRARALPGAALALLGPALYMGWLRAKGFPSIGEVYERHWATAVAPPWSTALAVLRELGSGNGALLLNLALLALALGVLLARRPRVELGLYCLAALGLFFTKKTEPVLQSTGRYLLALFPIHASAAALAADERTFRVRLLVLLLLNLGLLYTFLEWSLIV